LALTSPLFKVNQSHASELRPHVPRCPGYKNGYTYVVTRPLRAATGILNLLGCSHEGETVSLVDPSSPRSASAAQSK
jgi:hypothetical protein